MLSPEELKEKKLLKNQRRRVEKWLDKNHKYVNITALEREIEAPKGLIQKYVKYDKPMTDRWIAPLHSVMKNFFRFKL